jgi:cytochrome c-type biogenesis protein CcmH/NrfG
MAGSAAYERRDFRAAVRHWRVLLERYPAGSPEHREIAAAVARAERLGTTMLPADPAAPRSRDN